MPDESTSVSLTTTELEYLIYGLQMRMAYVETGNPYLRAADVKNMSRAAREKTQPTASIRSLDMEQMRLLVCHDDLIRKLQTATSGIAAQKGPLCRDSGNG